jgi:hypothetical protein
MTKDPIFREETVQLLMDENAKLRVEIVKLRDENARLRLILTATHEYTEMLEAVYQAAGLFLTSASKYREKWSDVDRLQNAYDAVTKAREGGTDEGS